MPFSVTPVLEFKPKPVGVVLQEVLAATNIKGEDSFLMVLTNPSATETFEGSVSSSPDGVNQWLPELNDEFASIPPGATRRMLLPGDRLFVRITGHYLGAPDTMYLSSVKLRAIAKRG